MCAVAIEGVKVVCTVLGYTTAASVAKLRAPAKIIDLENELLKLQQKTIVFEQIKMNYPQITRYLPFQSGFKNVIRQTASKVAQNLNEQSPMFQLDPNAEEDILEKAKKVRIQILLILKTKHSIISIVIIFKVCGKMSRQNILLNPQVNRPMCEIKCPSCRDWIKLSSCKNMVTKTITFSPYNFAKHFTSAHDNMNRMNKQPQQAQAGTSLMVNDVMDGENSHIFDQKESLDRSDTTNRKRCSDCLIKAEKINYLKAIRESLEDQLRSEQTQNGA